MNTKWLPCNLEVEAVLTHTSVWQPNLRKHILMIKLLKVTHFTVKKCMCKWSILWVFSVRTSRHISISPIELECWTFRNKTCWWQMTIAGQTCLINLELFETLLDAFHFLAIDILCWPVIKQLALIENCSTKFNTVVEYFPGTSTSVTRKLANLF